MSDEATDAGQGMVAGDDVSTSTPDIEHSPETDINGDQTSHADPANADPGAQTDDLTVGDGDPVIADNGTADPEPSSDAQLAELMELRDQHEKLVKSVGRMQDERTQLQRRLDEIEQEREAARQKAEEQNLSPYSRKHPDYDKWTRLYERAKHDQRTIAAMPEETRKQAEAVIWGRYSHDEMTLLNNFATHLEQQQQAVLSSPEDFVLGILDQHLSQYMQRFSTVQNEWTSVQQNTKDFFDKNKDLVEAHGEELAKLMDRGVPADIAAEHIRLQHKNESLATVAAGGAEAEARAKAQADALGSQAKLPQGNTRQTPFVNLAEGVDPELNPSDFIDKLVQNRQALKP